MGRILTLQTIDFTAPHSATPVLIVKASREVEPDLPGFQVVDVEIYDGDKWVRQVKNGRFVLSRDDTDDADPAGIITYRGVSIADWLLQRARVQWSMSAAEGERTWRAATPGRILMSLMNEAQARGWGTWFYQGFSATHDGDGVPWATTDLERTYRLGIPYSQVLDGLIQDGVVEYATDGFEVGFHHSLKLYNPGTGIDRTVDRRSVSPPGRGAVVSMASVPVAQAPVKRSIDDIRTRVTVQGEGDLRVTVEDFVGTDLAHFGQLESWVAAGGVDKPADATKIGEHSLAENTVAKTEMSFTYDANAVPAHLWPWRGFEPGDWILNRSGQKVRVFEVMLSKGEDSQIRVTVLVGDRFSALLPSLAKTQSNARIGAGSGGSGVVPSPNDARIPVAPTGLSLSNEGYWDTDGAARGSVTITWDEVTMATQGTMIVIDQYELWSRESLTEPWTRMTAAVDRVVHWFPLEPATMFYVRARAHSKGGVWGEWSGPQGVMVANPTDLPWPPTTAVVTQDMGAVSVAWDGLLDSDVGPVAPPKQHKHVITEQSDSETGTYLPVGQQLVSAGSVQVTGIGHAVTVWFRQRSVDRVGNISDPSSPVSITVEWDGDRLGQMAQDVIDAVEAAETAVTSANGKNRVVWSLDPASGTTDFIDGDTWFQRDSSTVIGQWEFVSGVWEARTINHQVLASIDLGKATVGQLDGTYIKANTITTQALAVGDFENYVHDPELSNPPGAWIQEYEPAQSLIWTPNSTVGLAWRLNANGQTVRVRNSHKFTAVPGEKFQIDGTGWSNATTATSFLIGAFFYDAAGTSLSSPNFAVPNTGVLTPFSIEATAPANSAYGTLFIQMQTSATSGLGYLLHDMSVRRKTTGQLIVDGAIDGKTITGAVVRTAASGQRVQLDSTGLKGFNAAGTAQTTIGTNGLLTAIGATIESAVSGQRVVLSGAGLTIYDPSGLAGTIRGFNDGAGAPKRWVSIGNNADAQMIKVGDFDGPDSAWSGLNAGEYRVQADTMRSPQYQNLNGGRSAPYAMAAGFGSQLFSAATQNFTITLPAGRFTNSAMVSVMGRATNQGVSFNAAAGATSISVFGFNGADGLTVPYQWIAVQMTPTSGPG
ncbi:fibronectin type III domain-containing protein [Homoserinimonas aerilata]|uniref:fibronectin type III domain-containing protein n=1 Tax=Homoserinimonas aerilata TaxID=1162970 RepID=UPI001152D1DF|nr:fibronectin type III domain-containing protein [Homoserinimonas aerilata]